MPRAVTSKRGRQVSGLDPAIEADAQRGGGEEPEPRGLVKLDAHVHSHASNGPALAALGLIGCPECYSPPEKVYDQAMARGMDLVTITDHDTIDGALQLQERGFERFIVGEEVTVYFPEDRCKLHVLVWGLRPEQHEVIGRLGLRSDVYAFANWLRDEGLYHAVAHPLYIQNGRLTRWHIERCALLFKGFETLNGAHAHTHRSAIERFLDSLTPARIAAMATEHGIEPVWPRAWQKARTGGSDDHGLLNIGRTWTEVRTDDAEPITDPQEFFRYVMAGRSDSRGNGGHSSLLAHQLTTVGAHYYADRVAKKVKSPTGRYVGSKLLRFAGVEVRPPSKTRLAVHVVKRRLLRRKRRQNPLTEALRTSVGPLLDEYPDLHSRLSPEAWRGGSALSEHERMADFAEDLIRDLSDAIRVGAGKAFRRRDRAAIADHLGSYLALQAAQVPYLFSLFYQNKERNFVDRFEHETAQPGTGVSVLERPMKVCLFTDTLGDVNGVCRFIRNTAERAHETGRDLNVLTSTRFPVPDLPNVFNFKPYFAMKMPKYEGLEMVLPPLMPMLRHVDRHQPDAIHISTPGPVGMIGYLAAKMMRVPVLGVYHTDFPAYIDHLFDDHALTYASRRFMRTFYGPFRTIFTRSADYAESLARMGIARERLCPLLPGVDTRTFHPSFRDETIWERLGAGQGTVKALYCGRVSVEKNMPQLVGVWKRVHARCRELGLESELIVVGDGPYTQRMRRELRGMPVQFLGFRHGRELSSIYASSDLFVFPSVTDTLGQVVMESQASGLPVLVSDIGGPREVVRHGETGYVLSAEDTTAWVERIVGLIADEDKRRRMGQAAHESMQGMSLTHSFEHFWEVHTRAWHDHLADLGITPKSEAQTLVPQTVTSAWRTQVKT